MKHIKNIMLLSVFILLSSCGKDDFIDTSGPDSVVVDEKIAGTAMMDQDEDGVGESPLSGATVYYADSIYKSYSPDWDNDPEILSVVVDQFGQYLFEGVPPAEGKALFLSFLSQDPHPDNFEVKGIDVETDGDAQETNPDAKINIDLDHDEVDDGNQFLATRHPVVISGSVNLDSNLDGLGDSPVGAYRVQLFTRMPDGQPSADFVGQEYTSQAGIYSFYDVDPGEYAIVIEPTSEYYIFSSGDATPDPDGIGDPNFPQVIPVDLEIDETDGDNNFILRTYTLSSISGLVGDDLDLDGSYDFGLQQIWVGLVDPAGNLLANTFTDENGGYLFESILPGSYGITLLSGDDFLFVAVGDFSDDGDPEDGNVTQTNFLPVVLELDEDDFDNNFHITIESGRVSGRVLEDVDNDGIGDKPVWNDIVLLHFRGPEGSPISNPAWPWNEEVAYTDVNGYYSFGNTIPDTGEFVIQHIGSGAHLFECIGSEDLSPEMGEPQNQHAECMFIQVDLLEIDSEDHHNVYVIDIQ